MNPVFDRYIAVDWSGAKGKSYGGIAVAACGTGKSAPVLLKPLKGKWSRSQFVDWIAAIPASSGRLLVGIDCAFSLPFAMASQLINDHYTAADLWRHIDSYSTLDQDFYGGGFAEHEDHKHLYWHSGTRPNGFVEHQRATEIASAKHKLYPESTLKLIGPKQVGKGSLAGMRVLHALKLRLGSEIAIWPFDHVLNVRIVCVEIYPRLFLRMAEQGNPKVSVGELNSRLANLGSNPAQISGQITGHDTDALVSAAGLRHIAADPQIWSPPGLDALAIRAEGWIFGVA